MCDSAHKSLVPPPSDFAKKLNISGASKRTAPRPLHSLNIALAPHWVISSGRQTYFAHLLSARRHSGWETWRRWPRACLWSAPTAVAWEKYLPQAAEFWWSADPLSNLPARCGGSPKVRICGHVPAGKATLCFANASRGRLRGRAFRRSKRCFRRELLLMSSSVHV